ncbi:hypothetical protein BEWA_050470 [Theileria equi strain WA]|uniref:Thioredoxin domain-containing protein n=1 Tax=Theileria equi strain WA TaxID=1537102 RepID=L1LBD3_THEEQ|nr:hypothetical protein BEWA_050470 [Theileria equi strain WA]EKX72579.1 hypothetical protein BEWA_050470 [Theileria equi strain WA]|eukprot:XP_004832031.1 hypothetical protein BEWA_050470 [Theileria equi strain WA]
MHFIYALVTFIYRDEADNKDPKFVLYKGLRKKYYGSEDLLDEQKFSQMVKEMPTFFEEVSQDAASLRQSDDLPEFVTLSNFNERVIKDASKRSPIIVQLYEDNCFLCFLVRPFINSVHNHLKEVNSPVRIKRLNIQMNDFPKGCPITRATPTFVFYTGGNNGAKWEEFKPQDFVRKLSEVAKLPKDSVEYLEKLAEDISQRFVMFGKLAHWMSESQMIQELVFSSQIPGEEPLTSSEDMYSRALRMLMDMDADRTDSLEENLEYLKGEINSAEQDCIAMSEILGKELVKQNV